MLLVTTPYTFNHIYNVLERSISFSLELHGGVSGSALVQAFPEKFPWKGSHFNQLNFEIGANGVMHKDVMARGSIYFPLISTLSIQ